jgi:hypothetical protein
MVAVSEALQVRTSSKHQQKKKSKINQLLTLALKRAHDGRSRGAAWTALNKEGRVGAYCGRAKMTLSYPNLTGRREGRDESCSMLDERACTVSGISAVSSG